MPIGFIPRMASRVGTAVCGTACTVVCEVAWGTNPHAPTRFFRIRGICGLETYWAAPHARGRCDGRQESCESGYYHLYRDINDTFLHLLPPFLINHHHHFGCHRHCRHRLSCRRCHRRRSGFHRCYPLNPWNPLSRSQDLLRRQM